MQVLLERSFIKWLSRNVSMKYPFSGCGESPKVSMTSRAVQEFVILVMVDGLPKSLDIDDVLLLRKLLKPFVLPKGHGLDL